MKKEKSTSGASNVGLGAVGFVALAGLICPPLMLPAMVAAIPVCLASRPDPDPELDEAAEAHADKVAKQWERNRKPGEKEITVSSTLPSGKGFLAAEVTRTYKYTIEQADD